MQLSRDSVRLALGVGVFIFLWDLQHYSGGYLAQLFELLPLLRSVSASGLPYRLGLARIFTWSCSQA